MAELTARARQRYTEKQGQYLAFIYYYAKIHRRSPSEAEMQEYFGVTAPVVHQMILSLEKNGVIERTAGKARSIRLLLPRHELPDQPLMDDVCPITYPQGFFNVMIGNNDTNSQFFQVYYHFLDVFDRDGIDAREWLIEEHVQWFQCHSARYLNPPPFTA